MQSFKLIKGGMLPREQCRKRFESASITDTRLMGAMGLHIHWTVLDSPDVDDLHQFFYLDCEEYGLESYRSVWDSDFTALDAISNSMIGCLGGSNIALSEREAAAVVQHYVRFNRQHHLPLPPLQREYTFLLHPEVQLSDEESEDLFARICGDVSHPYQRINYFLMRCFGHDARAAAFLTDGHVPVDCVQLPPATLCRNTIDIRDGAFLCESLLECGNHYHIVTSRLRLSDRGISAFECLSEFPVSSREAAMQLARPEFVTIYEMSSDCTDVEQVDLELSYHSMTSVYENGRLFMTFNSSNSHVNRRIYFLNEDVYGLYYITNYGQCLVASYDLHHIHSLEQSLQRSSFGSCLVPVAKYEFKEPVLYDFIQSDYEDFDDFLHDIQSDDE